MSAAPHLPPADPATPAPHLAEEPPELGPAAAWRYRLTLAALLLFGAGLLAMTVWTANPVVVSRPQVLAAPLVVEGELKAGDGPTRIRVRRVLFTATPAEAAEAVEGKELVVQDVQPARWHRTGQPALAALTGNARDGYRSQPVPFDLPPRDGTDPAPLYPATRSARRQAEALCRWRKQQRDARPTAGAAP